MGPCVEPKSGLSISAGGGASSVWVPTIPIGTERKGGEEFALTETDDQLTGGSFNIGVTAPLGRGYQGYFNYQYTEADGSSSAHVPEGDRLVAITFPLENPATGTTGIGPSPFGMNIITHTDFEMNDVQFGFGAPVNFFGPSVVTKASIGGRYINVDRTDRIGQTLIQFRDISQQHPCRPGHRFLRRAVRARCRKPALPGERLRLRRQRLGYVPGQQQRCAGALAG